MVTNIGDQAFVYDFKQEQEIWWQVIIIIRQFTKFSNGQIKIFIKYTPLTLASSSFWGVSMFVSIVPTDSNAAVKESKRLVQPETNTREWLTQDIGNTACAGEIYM